MAKTLVIVGEGERVPFLRGILTRAIQDAGVAFDEAYRVATAVRDELREVEEVTSGDLRERVAVHLQPFGQAAVDRFRHPEMPTILVRSPHGEISPYSRGRLRLRLEACGLGPTAAIGLASLIQERLVSHGIQETTTIDLRRLIHDRLKQAHGEKAARHYLVWEEFHDSGEPLLILLGGATGTGKSTIASDVAHQLEIIRTQPTDMLREVMRMMIPSRLMPVLHKSTFSAHDALPFSQIPGVDSEARLAHGYMTQATLIEVGCDAVVQRALSERVSLILEGIHVHPKWMMSVAAECSGAIVAPVMLAVLRPEVLRSRFLGRSREAPDRRARRYLDHFDEIRRLQSFLLSEADRCGVPIVTNGDRDRATHQVLGSVMQVLGKRFEGRPERVLERKEGT